MKFTTENYDTARLLRSNKRFWSGSVDLETGYVKEVYKFGDAEDANFHIPFYFSEEENRNIEEGNSQFFMIEDGEIVHDYLSFDTKFEDIIIDEIKKQIEFL